MSFWIDKMTCKKCSSTINVAGGMVNTTWMGPADKDVKCSNPNCDGVGFNNFISERFEALKVITEPKQGPPTYPGRMA